MTIPLIPHRRVGSIYELTPEVLGGMGKRLVLADLDNTLARYREPEPSADLLRWKERLEAAGIRVFILSNGRKPHRSRRFAGAFGVDYISHAGKPRRKGFDAALRETGCAAEEAVMVGDQIFTDIWGANNAGVTSVLTEPIALDTVFRRLRYWIETPFRTACRNEGAER